MLTYLARPGDAVTYGTQLYGVRTDGEAPVASPFYLEPGQCELAREVPFRRNTALVFLNSHGAHGASIPPDAPPDVERYIFQVRVGPDMESARRLMELMSPDARARWMGSKTDKLGLAEAY